MKRIISCLLPALFAVTISQSKPVDNRLRTEDREVSGFHGIASGGSFTVIVKLGNKESLSMEGDADAISRIETKVEKGILRIRNKSSMSWNDRNLGKVKIYVTAKSLNSLAESGSGTLEVTDHLSADDFSTAVSGSGSIRATISVKEYTGAVSGSGSVQLSGSSNHSEIAISGSGNFRGSDFKAGEADIRISGSGNADISAEKSLDVALSGSGTVRYSGNAVVTTHKSGSGRVIKL